MDDVAVGEQISVGGNEEARTGAARRFIPLGLDMNDRWMHRSDRSRHRLRIGIEQFEVDCPSRIAESMNEGTVVVTGFRIATEVVVREDQQSGV